VKRVTCAQTAIFPQNLYRPVGNGLSFLVKKDRENSTVILLHQRQMAYPAHILGYFSRLCNSHCAIFVFRECALT